MHTYQNSSIGKYPALTFLLIGTIAAAADTDISDTPMAVKNNIAPNFMYMIDNSGSMNNIVPDSPYSTSTTYLSNCPNNRLAPGGFSNLAAPNSISYDLIVRQTTTNPVQYSVRFVSTDGNNSGTVYTFGTASGQVCFNPNLYYNFRLNANGTSSTNSTTCGGSNQRCRRSDGSYLDAIYTGHFLNWYFGAPNNYTSGSTDNYYSGGRKPGTKTRMEVAKSGAKTVLNSIPLKTNSTAAKARVGLATYNSSDGGELRRPVEDLDATHLTLLRNSIDGISASGSTPLSETLADIGHYFSLNDTWTSDPELKMYPDKSNRIPASHNVRRNTLFRQGNSVPHRLDGVSSSTEPPIQEWCQKSYAILMTDGRPQNDEGLSTNSKLCDYDNDMSGSCGSGGRKTGAAATSHVGHLGGTHTYESNGSDYLDDVAQALYDIDLRPDLLAPEGRTKTKNNVRTYTIGFADEQAKNDPLLQETAKQGGGLFSIAGNEEELIGAFSKMMNDAFDQDGAAAAVAVVNTDVTIDNTSYASNYRSSYWTGDLRSYAIDTTTGEPNENYSWSAAAKLDALSASHTQRKIVTFNGTEGVPFQPANVSLQQDNNTELVNYLRGQKTYENDGDGTNDLFRPRSSLLGDIINAEPVIVKYAENGNSYSPIVFQAANDGMLHVFCGKLSSSAKCGSGSLQFNAGAEIFAYVPKMVWPSMTSDNGNLADTNYVHKYFVDATPEVADIISASSYKLLVGGLGKGGKGFYALNVSTYSAADEAGYANKVKWEFPASATSVASSVGYSYGTPLIVKTAAGYRVLVTSGYNNSDGTGKLFVLDPNDGSVVRTIDTGVGDTINPAGLTHIAKLNTAGATDTIRYVYGGDLLGNVWRFDLDSYTAVKIANLTDGDGIAQPITTAPVVATVPNSTTKYYVYVGTGKYLGDSDVPGDPSADESAEQTQSMYGIVDDLDQTPAGVPNIRGTNGNACPNGGGDGEFICQTVGPADNDGNYTLTTYAIGTKSGWYFDLPYANGRVIGRPLLTDDYVLAFTINVPTIETCDPGGMSAPAVLDAYNGGALPMTYNGTDYYVSIGPLADGLSSRFVQTDTATRRVGLFRRSDGTTGAKEIYKRPKCTTACPGSNGFDENWKKIYWRELN